MSPAAQNKYEQKERFANNFEIIEVDPGQHRNSILEFYCVRAKSQLLKYIQKVS